MRLRMALLAALILVGCSRGVQPQGPVPTAPVRLTPESSGVRGQLRLAEAVPGGELWLNLQEIPPGAVHQWRVGLTDGQGANYLFGMLTDEPDRTYRVPTTMAPGAGSLWISAGEEAPGPGSIRLPLTLLSKLPPPVDPVTLCTPVLAGVRPAIGADWVRASDGPCWVEWHQAASGLQVNLSWSEAESESWVFKERTVPIEGGRYQGQLGHQIMEKTGGAFWGPNAWALEVTGERGRVTVTCGMDMAPDREQGRARQVQVDAACPDLLSRTVVGDLGKMEGLP